MATFDVIKQRSEYYDRNPTFIFGTYNAGAVAPHVTVVRATYTCPANRSCKLGSAITNIVRAAVAAPAAQARATIRENVSLATISNVRTYNNIVGDIASTLQNAIGEGPIVEAGGGFEILTSDGGTGGSFDYNIGFTGVEFDV